MTSNRRLARMPPHLALTAGQLAKLALYPNGGIRTTKELLEKSKIELVENCDLDGEVVEDIMKKVSRWIAPKSVTVLSLLSSVSFSPPFFTTCIPHLDTALNGGIPLSSVTEIVGPSRSGKTQFCMTMSVIATMPCEKGGLGGSVCFIDTEGTLDVDRLVEIASNRFPDYFNPLTPKGKSNLLRMTQNVHIMNAKSTQEVLQSLEGLQELIITHKIRLVLFDSVGYIVRKEFNNMTNEMKDRYSSPSLMGRSDMLIRESAMLKFLAESFRIAVVVTNQVINYSKPHMISTSSNARKRLCTRETNNSYHVTSVLGSGWAHSITTQLTLECFDSPVGGIGKNDATENAKRIKISKSPIAPRKSFYYAIDKCGIVELDLETSNEVDSVV
ncbi:9147_t:CDS:2 [Paraglomus occultum]|uniref:9147_t:CDS:1 n=1 Tax=Paraglomus occultum TaxID=144539 RepID=A0A9N9FGJ7_9GLOM|nr:9147_t:CDS:2 [Paraglomus occultum]